MILYMLSPLSLYLRCGKCRRYMKFIQAKPSRMYCTNCDETYNLPQQGSIKLYKELKCPLDDFELVQWTAGGKGKVGGDDSDTYTGNTLKSGNMHISKGLCKFCNGMWKET